MSVGNSFRFLTALRITLFNDSMALVVLGANYYSAHKPLAFPSLVNRGELTTMTP